MEENPTRAVRLELHNVKSWKSVLGPGQSLFMLALFLHIFHRHLLLGWILAVLQVWRALCPQSDRFLVEGVEEPVASTAHCTLGPFRWWSVHVT